MVLVSLKQFTNSGEHRGEHPKPTAEKRRVVFCARQSDKEENENVKYPKPEPDPCVVTQGSRRRSRAVVFPLPPLVVTIRLHRKCRIVLLPPTAPEQVLHRDRVCARGSLTPRVCPRHQISSSIQKYRRYVVYQSALHEKKRWR